MNGNKVPCSSCPGGSELRWQADHRYEIDVTYRDDLYDVVIRERLPRGVLREVPLLDLAPCRNPSARLLE